jgi:aldehyde:ferredoxin oxidoreductase
VGKVIRIFLDKKNVIEEDISTGWELMGGRGMCGKIIVSEVPPETDPLGPYNKLVFAPGLLAGTVASSSGRLSIGGKSPLTGGIKESNVGGTAGQKLARLGIGALVLEGVSGEQSIIHISKEGIKFELAGELGSLKTYDTVEKLQEKFGKKITVLGIGPAGEKRLLISGIFVTDVEGRPTRYAARGGLGAVLGSKNIKAIVIDDSNCEKLSYENRSEFFEL